MICPGETMDEVLGRFRASLSCQDHPCVDPHPPNHLDLCGIVSQTLCEAREAFDRGTGWSAAQRVTWLNMLLANNVRAAQGRLHAECSEIQRNRSGDTVPQRSSSWHVNLVAANQSSLSRRPEREQRLAVAVEALPDDQRRAFTLRRTHGWSVLAIAEYMNQSTAAVVELLQQAWKTLEEELNDLC